MPKRSQGLTAVTRHPPKCDAGETLEKPKSGTFQALVIRQGWFTIPSGAVGQLRLVHLMPHLVVGRT